MFAGAAGLTAAALGWRPAIAPVASVAPASSLYTAETIERGRRLAAIGDCAVCHTAEGGATNAGSRPLPTPFGTIHSTNLTPDVATGIGAWSFSAFQRAMREGISRDGRHLYPAFPYTAYAKTSDDDLMALYAYLMSQPAVANVAPANDLRFPFNRRALMPAWNALFHDPTPFQPEPGADSRMEPRRLSGQRPRPLRGMPHTAQRARCGARRDQLPGRRDGRRLGSTAP